MIYFLLLLSLTAAGFASAWEHVCVKGRMRCGPEPELSLNQEVKLMDDDGGFSNDDEMAKSLTDHIAPEFFPKSVKNALKVGKFKLCGGAQDREALLESIAGKDPIEPFLQIRTRCNIAKVHPDAGKECYRRIRFYIEPKYISRGEPKTKKFTFIDTAAPRPKCNDKTPTIGSWCEKDIVCS